MCFTGFCARYDIPDPDGNKAYCWACSTQLHRDECEEEELARMEEVASGIVNEDMHGVFASLLPADNMGVM